MKRHYGAALLGRECEMEAWGNRHDPTNLLNCELIIRAVVSITDGLTFFSRAQVAPHSNKAKRREHCVVEASSHLYVLGTKRDVMKHS